MTLVCGKRSLTHWIEGSQFPEWIDGYLGMSDSSGGQRAAGAAGTVARSEVWYPPAGCSTVVQAWKSGVQSVLGVARDETRFTKLATYKTAGFQASKRRTDTL